ncbi:sucrose phosphorylase [Herbinix hemicellulosilytica]|uniref:Sucrose 6(F)-phosphate phosphorylase n=1 Tax=Herbinix hemicellulosilytica TaxID=1564487 RepID=A0A0H5SHB9_HERHM|nr:sucrose phosphorylase [Herbinix hemicellulosilytica]RBP58881.1 sucrose phosphorylase [Herbinix hemicellulosilytica]CRZ34912.1 Sucrose phosphorylase [Herbinix hemicellulosilytica]
MKKIDNKIMLITYPDSFGQNLKELNFALNKYVKDAIGGIHLLPFFPSSGDRGFAPITYREVERAFGNWEDVMELAKRYYMMYDYMINHISARSEYYKDFLHNKDNSPYHDLFIRYKKFWENGEPTKEQLDAIYKRKPRAPYVEAKFADGTTEKVWCTFDEEQIDINCKSDIAKKLIKENLSFLAEHGASIIRLDAFAYATKKAGTSCFFIEPDVWELLELCDKVLEPYNIILLPEIHEHYSLQMKIADKGYYTYDFALPMLLIHALYYGEGKYLKNWLDMCPRRQFTTLDTHDGIGVVDVKDLLPDNEINRTQEDIFRYGANVKKIYNTSAYNNLDIYQINCTYYSALGDNDQAYLLARAIQFFAPGIPQVYYVGLLAGKNDLEFMERTKFGRNINRHNYTLDEIEREVNRPVVQKLLELMRFRNSHKAFNIDGDCIVESKGSNLKITRKYENHYAILDADLKSYEFSIDFSKD